MSGAGVRDDWRGLPLEPGGRSLIEASAGTGKTWTIAVLYVRLLLEQSLSPRQVVVASFTEAAAEELHERIRTRLLEARALLAHWLDGAAAVAGDAWSEWLHGQCREAGGDGFDRDRARRADMRLRLALSELDLAPIGTLHALCQRILREAPFDSGSGFQADALLSGEELVAELADDAWRRLVQAGATLDPAMQAWVDAGRDALGKALGLALQPGVRVAPAEPLEPASIDAVVAAARRVLGGPNRFKSSASVMARGLPALVAWAEAGATAPLPQQVLDQLGKEPSTQFKPAHLDDDDVVALLDALPGFLERACAAATAPRAQALARMAETARRERDARLRARGQLTFDALVERAHGALQAHPALADTLHARWPVALVDEFQDTDGQQYAVLDRIYRDRDGVPRGRLVMIGDPKQAIYGFRGGDIHAYLHAASQVPEAGRMRLDVNRRSSRAYVAACNDWFAAAGTELSTRPAASGDGIAYVPVQPCSRLDGEAYTVDGQPEPRPLVLHYRADAPASAGERKEQALASCADHVVSLLSGGHAIAGTPLQPGDIAILVPTNRDVARLRELLQARRVPSVGAARSSVFHSTWAHDLHIQLQAAAMPHDGGLVRAALATRLGGFDYAGLRALVDAGAESAWRPSWRRPSRCTCCGANAACSRWSRPWSTPTARACWRPRSASAP